jgi:hypothetical protein
MVTFNFLANNFSLETTLSLDSSSLNLLEQALLRVREGLRSFAGDPEFSQKLALAFGDSFDAQRAQDLAQAWRDGDFSVIPPIEVLSAEQLNGANGAFAVSTNRIYLSQAYLSNISVIENDSEAISLQSLVNLLLEEIGHKIDTLLNALDSQGDEGAIFAKIVQMHRGGGRLLALKSYSSLRRKMMAA